MLDLGTALAGRCHMDQRGCNANRAAFRDRLMARSTKLSGCLMRDCRFTPTKSWRN